MAIGLSHGGTNVYSTGEHSTQLWVATQDGLRYSSAPTTASRNPARPARPAYCAIIFEQTTGTMFAARSSSIHATATRQNLERAITA